MIDLFAGIGGFHYAAQQVWPDLKVLAHCEIDPFCQEALKKHWPEVPVYSDIHDLTVDTHGNVLYIGEKGDIMPGKLSERYISAVEMYNRGLSIQECANFFGVTRQAMHKILQRRCAVMRVNNRKQVSKFKLSEDRQFIDVSKMDEKLLDMVAESYNGGNSIFTCSGQYGIGVHVIRKILVSKKIKTRGTGKSGRENNFYRGGIVSGGESARILAYSAIRKCILQRKPCEVCGAFGVDEKGKNIINAHHDDYNKPIDVRWLCHEHHFEWHKSNKAKGIEEAGESGGAIDIVSAGFPCQ